MLLRRALLKPPLDLLDLWPPLYLRRYPKCMDSREVDSREVAASGVHRARFSCSTTREKGSFTQQCELTRCVSPMDVTDCKV